MRVIYPSLLAVVLCGHASASELKFDWGEVDIFGDARLRYEFVDQDSFDRNANALTLSGRYGVELKTKIKLDFLVEGESVVALVDDYNNLRNMKTQFPIVQDPEDTEINRAQVSYSPMESVKLTLGRQYIDFGGMRLVGTNEFRQNHQTFDAAMIEYSGMKGLRARYAYINQVNRNFGDSDPVNGRFHGDIHAYQIDYSPIEQISIHGFGLMLQIDEAPFLDTGTHGAAITGRMKNGLGGVFAYAKQKDRADNPLEINLDYFYADISYQHARFSVKAAFESLEGNGEMGVMGPLGALHEYQGFAEVLSFTPADGIDDLYFTGDVKLGNLGPLQNIKAAAWYHDFETEHTGESLGEEIDFLLTAELKRVTLGFKLASYNGVEAYPSRDKFWFTVAAKF